MIFMPDPRQEREKLLFILCFVSCLMLLSLLELGADRMWDSLTKRSSGETAVEVTISKGDGAVSAAPSETPTQEEAPRWKIPAAEFILAVLLNILISGYVAARYADRGHTVQERFRRRLRKRIKYLA